MVSQISSKEYVFPCGCKFPIVSNVGGVMRIKFPTDSEMLPKDCQRTWDLYEHRNTKGVFQLESNLGRTWAGRVKPKSIEEASDLIALMRPGCLEAKMDDGKSLTEHYVMRKDGLEEVEYPHPCLEEILKPTQGILTYQEQSIKIVKLLGGFSDSESEVLRKCVSGDTRFISKTRGWITIDRLITEGYKDDKFLVMDENGKQYWKKISSLWCNGKHGALEVETRNGFSVKATKYHQFLTNHGWKARRRLNIGKDYAVCARKIEYDGVDSISKDMAMVVAGLLTEGYFVSYATATFVNHDAYLMKIFTDSLTNIFGDKANKTTSDEKVFVIKDELKQDIHKYMTYGKSGEKVIPESMMGMTLETTRQFLSFMFGCECGVTKSTGVIEYSSKSQVMIKQVQLLLLRFGVTGNILVKFNDEHQCNYYRLFISDRKERARFIKQLHCCLPKYKKDDIKYGLKIKLSKNYSGDSIPNNITKKLINQYPQVCNFESGSIHNEEVTTTRDRFKRLVEKTKDKYWLNFVNGKHRYDLIVSDDNSLREIKTYDFTIEDETTPYIIANGMVIHNCMGKKKADLMAKVKIQFLEAAKKVNLVDIKVAEDIFNWIEKSQRYNFCQAHAVAYAANGYLSAYAKAHIPRPFFTSYLTFAKDGNKPFDEIKQLVNNAKMNGIQVSLPDLRRWNEDFKLIDKTIYFGLSNIKNISDKSIEKLKRVVMQAKDDQGAQLWAATGDITWVDFLVLLSDDVNSKVMEGLIGSGSLDYMKVSRTRMTFEFNIWRGLKDRENKYIRNFYVTGKYDTLAEVLEDLAKGEIGRGKQCSIMSVDRFNEIETYIRQLKKPPFSLEDTAEWISEKENHLLGISMTCTKVEGCDISQANCTCIEFLDGVEHKKFYIAVNISAAKPYETKKNKEMMCFLEVNDITAYLDCVLFSDKMREYSSLLTEGNTVMLVGSRSKRDKNSLTIDKILQL